MYGGEGGGLGDLLGAVDWYVCQGVCHRVGVGLLDVGDRAAALVQRDQQRARLRQLVLKNVEVRLDAFEAIVVDLWGFVVHRHQVLVVLPYLFGLALVARLEHQLLQQLPQPDAVRVILGGQHFLKRLVVGHITGRERLLYLLEH